MRVEVPFETVRRLPVIHASVAGKSGAFVLDTGSEGTLVDRKFLGLKKAGDGAALGSGGIMGAPSNVGEFCISAHCIGKTQVWLIDFDGYSEKMGRRVDGIIGQDFLQRFDSVTFDYVHRRVILEKGNQK